MFGFFKKYAGFSSITSGIVAIGSAAVAVATAPVSITTCIAMTVTAAVSLTISVVTGVNYLTNSNNKNADQQQYETFEESVEYSAETMNILQSNKEQNKELQKERIERAQTIQNSSPNSKASWKAYIDTVKTGSKKALAPLERMANTQGPEQQLELSQLYTKFGNKKKANYWKTQAKEEINARPNRI